MTVVPPRGHLLPGNLFRRPAGMIEETRWIFYWLVTTALIFTAPVMLLTTRGGLLPVGLGCAGVLFVSWGYGRAVKKAPIVLDLVDAGAFLLLAQAFPTPMIVLLVVTGALWFRGLYGSTVRALMRSALYSAAFLGAVVLWPF